MVFYLSYLNRKIDGEMNHTTTKEEPENLGTAVYEHAPVKLRYVT